MTGLDIYTVVAGSVGLLTGTLVGLQRARYWYKNRNPWIMHFTFDPPQKDNGPLKRLKVLKLPPGVHKVRFEIYMRRATTLSKVGFRPQARKGILRRRDNVYSDSAVRILDVQDKSRHWWGRNMDKGTQPDDARGRWIQYKEGADIPEGYYLWYELKIEAPGKWKGEIGFSTAIEGKRRFVHRKVEINDKFPSPPTWTNISLNGPSQYHIAVPED